VKAGTRKALVAAVLLVGIAGIAFGVLHLASPREPTYQGKTLSEWIVPFCQQTAKGLDAPAGQRHFQELEPARQAVKEIGTNAIPFLIARLNHRESALRRTVRQILEKQHYVRFRLSDPNVSIIRAIRALAILGPAAQPAIPSLTAQITDMTLWAHAINALSWMGAEGIRALVEQYTNAPASVRMEIAATLVFPASVYRGEDAGRLMEVSFHKEAIQIQTNEISADVLIEGFLQIARDGGSPIPGFGIQSYAIERLGMYGPLASNAVPVLLPILNDFRWRTHEAEAAIRALGQIRSRPEVVVPALTNVLNNAGPETQVAAASALRAFGYDAKARWQAGLIWTNK
jgi:hypothetical protein